ncbi:MAG TPA: hypothetical protein VH157_12490, partial [Bryobacteraceae bacterium]|nr:hypothetical protein [Bryobacteraceae bacterium]
NYGAIGEDRLLMSLQVLSPVPWPLIYAVTGWSCLMFAGMGLLSRPNAATIVMLILAAASVSVAILLILEFCRPYTSSTRISPIAIDHAIAELAKPTGPGIPPDCRLPSWSSAPGRGCASSALRDEPDKRTKPCPSRTAANLRLSKASAPDERPRGKHGEGSAEQDQEHVAPRPLLGSPGALVELSLPAVKPISRSLVIPEAVAASVKLPSTLLLGGRGADVKIGPAAKNSSSRMLGSWLGITRSHWIRGWQGIHPVSQTGVHQDQQIGG